MIVAAAAILVYLLFCASLPYLHRRLEDLRWRRFVARVGH